jgi:E3 ubiquitin-protein ligase HUWE1
MRLDNEIDDRSKKGAKIRSACKQIKEFCEQDIKSFAESPFGQLITMLSYDIIRKNTMLTDKLLRLLSLISIILADDKYKNNNLSKPPQQQIQNQQSAQSEETNAASSSSSAEKPSNEVVKAQDNNNDLRERLPESERHLALTVDVLTSKSCSEDGLEDATSLLINLSQCSSMTKYMIIKLLVKGVIDLSHMVQKHINNLMVELRELNETIKNEKLKPESNNDDSDELSKPSTSRGTLKDRFTKDAVIITAPSKVKTSNDLQLPSMAPLLSKTSNQSFFLRILKVITQIRDTVRQDSKVCDADVEQQLVKLETVPLSELLDLDSLWNTLSDCLKELEETQDHHAVLVLQPTVEAFFIVHSAPQVKTTIAERNLAARTIRNAGTAANPEVPQRDNNATTENANNNQANEERTNQENNTEQQQAQPQQVHLNIPIDETAVAAAGSNSEAGTSHERLSPMDTTQSSSDGSAQASSSTGGLQQQVSQQNLTQDQKKFLHFAETHRVVLNQILRQSSVHLADGPFAVLVDHTRVLDFDVKRRYFRIELERLDDGVRREEVAVHVHRANVFEDSFRELYRRSPEEWKNRFYIVFEDEEGQDAGGLLREWYMIISREIFNPMYALFTVSPGDRVTYMINPSSHCNPNHLCYFKFVGRVIAKAIYDNKLLECYFTRAFYKHILGIQVKYTDMESEDYAFYQGLVYLMENHVESLGYDLTFSLEIQEFGVTEVRELKPNGGNITVTEENKLEYIQLVCQLKMSGSIKQQLNAFLEGFYDIIPKRLISIFNEQELELLISGLPNIDIEDLRANTEYHKYQATSIQIQWFWRALRSFDQAERAKFLQFVTGTSKVPLQGFGALEGMNGIQKFQIHRDDRSTDRLPSAHTCFNQLDLPVYKSYDKLRTNLMKAIHECSEGFGFA